MASYVKTAAKAMAMKTQPKSILKKNVQSPADIDSSKPSPFFFTGNENDPDESSRHVIHTFTEHHFDKTHSDQVDLKRLQEKVKLDDDLEVGEAKSQSIPIEEEDVDVFKQQPSVKSSKVRGKRRFRPGKRSRRYQSAVYTFYSREIQKEILKILLTSTELFLKKFKQSLDVANGGALRGEISDSELFSNKYKSEFLRELKSFIINSDGRQRNSEYANQLGASFSEPIMSRLDLLRSEIDTQEKADQKKAKLEQEQDLVFKSFLEKNQLTSGSDSDFFGSLPTTSIHMDSYSKELKVREVVLLKNFRRSVASSQNMDYLTTAHLDQRNIESLKERNKCIVSAASTTRKIVRFADSFGLDLERVRVITSTSFVEALNSASDDDDDDDSNLSESDSLGIQAASSKPFLVLIPLFSVRRSDSQLIKLDNYTYDYENKLIKCIARVKNICFEKEIFARITFNNWRSHYDLSAFYIKSEQVKAGLFDYFGFCIIIPERSSLFIDNLSNDHTTTSSHFHTKLDDCIYRIEFALGFREGTTGIEHWDNNAGDNYKFQCFFNK